MAFDHFELWAIFENSYPPAGSGQHSRARSLLFLCRVAAKFDAVMHIDETTALALESLKAASETRRRVKRQQRQVAKRSPE